MYKEGSPVLSFNPQQPKEAEKYFFQQMSKFRKFRNSSKVIQFLK